MNYNQSAFITEPFYKPKSLAELGGSTVAPYTASSSLNLKPFESSVSANALTTGVGKQDYSGLQPSSEGGFSMPDAGAMQAYTGLAGTLVGALGAFDSYKTAKLQRQGLKQNIAQAKTDNDFRANVRSNLGTHTTGGGT